MSYLVSFLLSSIGLTVLIVWPPDGPGAWVRESVLRRALPGKSKETLDCYICTGFWSGLVLSPVWWLMCRERWTWSGCLMTPALFWLVLRNPGNSGNGEP
jgi:hypothetical protein